MTTAIDTNILVTVWDADDALSTSARIALDAALSRGPLVISAPVYAELLAAPSRSEAFLDFFLRDTSIGVEWDLGDAVWRAAGRAFGTYAARRKKHADGGTRRILADFLIGAHALRRGYRLLALDDRFYRVVFPHLRLAPV